jgi:hypothetical protein
MVGKHSDASTPAIPSSKRHGVVATGPHLAVRQRLRAELLFDFPATALSPELG